jgi:5-formyltetrahydrofolate cyclo-ligase
MKHLQLRNSLSKGEISKKSSEVEKRLFLLPEFKKSNAILFYASFGKEIETEKMIEKALANKKNVCVPVTSFKDKTLLASSIKGLSDLEKKPNGLIEPRKINSCPIEKIDLIVVPGVVFDEEGYRVGYGGGFYDRLLKKAPRKTVTVGLCFEQNIAKNVPKQSHDAKMDFVISEKRVIACK